MTLEPIGHDPSFQPGSNLWNYELIGQEEEYYNTSKVRYASPITYLSNQD